LTILNFLRLLIEDELVKEDITPKLLDMVDLSIAYSPVIPFAGGDINDAVQVRPWGFVPDNVTPEKFEVVHPLIHNPVGPDALKIMRARYLLARDAHYGPILDRFFHGPVDDNG
jgi:hypothetical protein